MKWTEHLRAPEVTRPAAAAAPANTPYGIGAGGNAAFVPLGDSAQLTAEDPERSSRTSNLAGGVSFLFGIVAIVAMFINTLPGSQWLWVCGAAAVAIVAAAVGLLRRASGRATNIWTPLLGILFGAAAAATALLGVNTTTLVNSVVPGLIQSPTTAPRLVETRFSTEPFVFGSNTALTSDGSIVQQLATALNETYAGGNATLAAGQTWPHELKLSASKVVTESGAAVSTMPNGYALAYALSADAKTYSLSVRSGDGTESASYYSASNKFSFHCAATDTNCVPAS